ncbi:MAG: hypothetical protein OHK0037_22870 [Elainellaceae cyanobacterium]
MSWNEVQVNGAAALRVRKINEKFVQKNKEMVKQPERNLLILERIWARKINRKPDRNRMPSNQVIESSDVENRPSHQPNKERDDATVKH